MKAVVVAPSTPERLVIRDVEAPVLKPDDALVLVKAISLNRGETFHALREAEAGFRPGWDLAGVVERAAPDGSGPKVGE